MITQVPPPPEPEIWHEDETADKSKEISPILVKTIITIPVLLINILSFVFLPKIGLGLLVIFLIILSILFLSHLWHIPKEDSSPEFKKNMTGLEYERFVATKLRNEGFTNVEVTPGSGDHGADILAVTPEGKSVAIQCKLYTQSVGQHAVQEAVAAREYFKCDQAMVITNSTFTPAAEDFARNTETILRERFT